MQITLREVTYSVCVFDVFINIYDNSRHTFAVIHKFVVLNANFSAKYTLIYHLNCYAVLNSALDSFRLYFTFAFHVHYFISYIIYCYAIRFINILQKVL